MAKGQTMPDNSIEGGLKAVSLSLPPISGASAGDKVLFIIAIDPDGNVKPVRKTQDDAGLAPQVMAAAKSWRFNPPVVKGKPVSTNIRCGSHSKVSTAGLPAVIKSHWGRRPHAFTFEFKSRESRVGASSFQQFQFARSLVRFYVWWVALHYFSGPVVEGGAALTGPAQVAL